MKRNKKKGKLFDNYKEMPIFRRFLMDFAAVFTAFLFTSVSVQFVPPLFIGNFQLEFFLFWIGYSTLFFLIFNLFLAHWFKISIFLILIPLIVPLAGLGWNYNTIAYNVERNIIHARNRIGFQVEIRPSEGVIQPHISLQRRMQQKVNYTDKEVRNFAVRESLLYFDEYYNKYGQICRQYSILKFLKVNYKYVKDPSGTDYFASPIESMELMAGDCDDYTILAASMLESIGARVRIIWAPRHVYPELYCGDQASFDKYVSAIYAMFKDEIGDKRIFYRLDKNGDYWINIDYSDTYPGSYYISDEVLSIIYVE